MVINGLDSCVRYNRMGWAKNAVDFLLPRYPGDGSVGDSRSTSWSTCGKLTTDDVYRLFSLVDDMKRAEKTRLESRAWKQWQDSDYDYTQKITADLYVGSAHQFITDYDHPDKVLPTRDAVHVKDMDISIKSIRAAFNAVNGDLGTVLDGRVKAMKPLKLKSPAA
jgi:hypothetical protein